MAQAIEITGQGEGDIVFEQNGGGFVLLSVGTVRLFGNAVSLQATDGDIRMNGEIAYTVPEGNTPTEASEAVSIEAEVPAELPDPETDIRLVVISPRQLVSFSAANV